jgi:hypothetical protein
MEFTMNRTTEAINDQIEDQTESRLALLRAEIRRRKTDAETPRAECTVVWSTRDTFWSVTVIKCPLCGRKHFHGAGSDREPDLGARRSHCGDQQGDYELVETVASRAARGERAS